MDNSSLDVVSIAGELSNVIAKSLGYKEAIENGLKTLISHSFCKYAVVWFPTSENPKILYPYYWISTFDYADEKRILGEGLVGKTCLEQSAQLQNNIPRDDPIRKLTPNAKAILCCPFISHHKTIGCVEFIRTDKIGSYTKEEIDACSLLTKYIAEITKIKSVDIERDESNKESIIKVTNIKKSYVQGTNVTKVLRGINLNAFKGEFLCLLGESGCGKTTLLNIISGLTNADSGSVLFEGKELVGLSKKELTKFRRENLGFIFQSYNLMPNLSAVDNVKLIAELVKNPMDSLEALKVVGLEDRANNYPSELSGGQQQRVSIARALVKNPKVIFADEPTAALDYETSIEVLEVFENVVKTGTTLVMITHNEEIAKMADRVIRFKNGKVFETYVNVKPLTAKELEW